MGGDNTAAPPTLELHLPQRELIIGFFAYNAAQMVISFHYFVDLCTDTGIKFRGEPSKLTAYEQVWMEIYEGKWGSRSEGCWPTMEEY